MIGALLLAVATVTGGYVATYTFDRSAAVYARLATGAVLGLTLLAFAGFAFALLFGRVAAPVLILAALMTLIPLVTLRSAARREEIAGDLRAVGRAVADAIRHPGIPSAVTVIYGLVILVWAWLVADRTTTRCSGGRRTRCSPTSRRGSGASTPSSTGHGCSRRGASGRRSRSPWSRRPSLERSPASIPR